MARSFRARQKLLAQYVETAFRSFWKIQFSFASGEPVWQNPARRSWIGCVMFMDE